MRFLAVSLLVLGVAAAGCKTPCQQNLPPAQMLMHPGPGADGPGPGVMMYRPGARSPSMTTQIKFVGPDGATIAWDVTAPGAFDSEPLVAPGRYNFPQGAIYRLKLTNVPGRPGVELFPTMELAGTMPRTEAFLAHNAVPVQFTQEDFDQVLSGNFVTKVIYLPDPAFQELALAGVETLVSTRLDPGVDPLVEAQRRGAILAVLRMGDKDLQSAGPPMPENGVMPTAYQGPADGGPMPGGPMPGAAMMGGPMPMGVSSTMPPYIAGYNAPQYGMPMCGTPIGLPGPPSVPMGVPAGLQQHVMVNRTHDHLPDPTTHERIVVKQKPGFSYPKPAHNARIVEHASTGLGSYRQPVGNRHEQVQANGQPCEQPCEQQSDTPSSETDSAE